MKNNDSVSYVKKNTGKKHRGYMQQLQVLFRTENASEVREKINLILSQFGYTSKDKIELIDIRKIGRVHDPEIGLEFRINNQYNIKLLLRIERGQGLEITLTDSSGNMVCYEIEFECDEDITDSFGKTICSEKEYKCEEDKSFYSIGKMELLAFKITNENDKILYSFQNRYGEMNFRICFADPFNVTYIDKEISISIQEGSPKLTNTLLSYFMNMNSTLTIDEIYKDMNALLCNTEDICFRIDIDHFPEICRENKYDYIGIHNGIPTEITLMDMMYHHSINSFGGTIEWDGFNLFYYRSFSDTAENVKEKMPEYSEELKSVIRNLINRAITILGDKANYLFSEYVKQEDDNFMKNYKRGYIEEPIEEYGIEPQNKNASDDKALVRKLVKKEIKNLK